MEPIHHVGYRPNGDAGHLGHLLQVHGHAYAPYLPLGSLASMQETVQTVAHVARVTVTLPIRDFILHTRKEAIVRITRWFRVAVVGALALGLSACAGQGAPQQTAASAAGPVTLQFWHGMTGPDGPAVQKVIDAFNKSQSDIIIKPNIMPWDQLYQKLLTSVTSSDGPQIIAMDASRVPQYAAKGALASTVFGKKGVK